MGREKVIDELAPAMIREIVPRGLLFTPDDGFGFGARSPLAILMVSFLLATFARVDSSAPFPPPWKRPRCE